MADSDLGSAVDGLLSLTAALARRVADPRGKAVVEGSTSEPLKTEPTPRARTGQPSAAKKQRVAPRVAG